MKYVNLPAIFSLVNGLARRAGVQVIRLSTLNELIARGNGVGDQAAGSGANAGPGVERDSIEQRLATLELKTERSIQELTRYSMKAHWRLLDFVDLLSGAHQPERCPLCGHSPGSNGFPELVSQCHFWGGRLLRHECPSCDLVFGPQKMLALDAEMLALDYRNLYRIYSEGNSTESVIRTFNLLSPSQNGIYLDYGSGGEWSEAIRRLRLQGWNVYGFEPNADHSSEFVFSRWEELSERRFDGIFSHNVLEHLFDPVGVTRQLAQLLSDGGQLVHATPCFEYRYDFTHYHVFFFKGRSAEVLAEKSGMRISRWVRDGEYMAAVFQKAV